jgi:predicted Zn-dependent protease
VVLFLTTSVGFIVFGIPSFSNFIVERLPKSVDKEVGRTARIEILKSSKVDSLKSKSLTDFYLQLGFDSNTKIYVVKSNENEFNAFALPDNSIFVYDEVLKKVETYDELAALLSHEYSHIKNRHGMKSLASSISYELLFGLLSGNNNNESFTNNAGLLLVLRNSRDIELEADKGGIDLIFKNKINPDGFIALFNRMIMLSENEKHIPAYLSTHPDAEVRLEAVKNKIAKQKHAISQNHQLEQLFQEIKSNN